MFMISFIQFLGRKINVFLRKMKLLQEIFLNLSEQAVCEKHVNI